MCFILQALIEEPGDLLLVVVVFPSFLNDHGDGQRQSFTSVFGDRENREGRG